MFSDMESPSSPLLFADAGDHGMPSLKHNTTTGQGSARFRRAAVGRPRRQKEHWHLIRFEQFFVRRPDCNVRQDLGRYN